MPRRSPAPKPERTPEEWADLRRRGEAGDTEAIGELTYLHHDIDDTGIDDGDLAARAEREVIYLATSTIAEEAALARYVAEMRTNLDGPSPSPIERLLVDGVVTCWLDVSLVRERWAHALKAGAVGSLKDIDRLLDSAQRRYLDAHKTLATVRRLIIPVVQVNMAKQQVNMVVASSNGQV